MHATGATPASIDAYIAAQASAVQPMLQRIRAIVREEAPQAVQAISYLGDDLLRLIFTACHPVLSTEAAGGADAAPARRPEHRRDRARLPGDAARADHRAAHRARQAHAVEARVPFEVPRAPSACRAWRRCSKWST
jgi:predicted RNA polymerase sigma factor